MARCCAGASWVRHEHAGGHRRARELNLFRTRCVVVEGAVTLLRRWRGSALIHVLQQKGRLPRRPGGLCASGPRIRALADDQDVEIRPPGFSQGWWSRCRCGSWHRSPCMCRSRCRVLQPQPFVVQWSGLRLDAVESLAEIPDDLVCPCHNDHALWAEDHGGDAVAAPSR